jgi:AraC-like DNA-binding protein
LLNLAQAEPRVRLERYVPDEPVAAFVEHYWIVRWDLRDQPPFTSESLPYPSVHLVLEQGHARVQGVPTGKFRQTLRDTGMVFGVKFKPGGLRPFLDGPVAKLTNRTLPAARVLSWADDYAAALRTAPDDDMALVECAAHQLTQHLPEPDPQIAFVCGVVEAVAENRSLVRVEQLVDRFGVSARSLQRVFREYVGASPKWVIQRYRLFEASARLANGEDSLLVASELGYFDQAHFIRDFKALIGQPPGAFAAGAH